MRRPVSQETWAWCSTPPCPDCPLTCDSEDSGAPWRSRLAVIIQMRDYEKGRAVTPPGGPRQPNARRDVWLLVTAVSRRESAPSAGIASRSIWGLFQPYLQHNTSISLVITQAYKYQPLSANIFQKEKIKASNNGGKLILVTAGFSYLWLRLRLFFCSLHLSISSQQKSRSNLWSWDGK